MQLTYRGARYTAYNRAVKTVETDLKGTFRGSQYTIRAIKQTRHKRIAQPLVYRMVGYFI